MDLCVRSSARASGGLDCTPFCATKRWQLGQALATHALMPSRDIQGATLHQSTLNISRVEVGLGSQGFTVAFVCSSTTKQGLVHPVTVPVICTKNF